MATKPLIKESLFLLNACGLNPIIQNKWAKMKTFLALALLIIIAIELALQMIFNWKGLSAMDGATSFVVIYQITSKGVLMIIKRQLFLKLLSKMEQFSSLNQCSCQLQLEIKTIYATVKKFMKLFITMNYTTIGAYFLRPLLTVTRTLPFDTYHPTDRYQSPQYQLQYILQIVQIGTACSFLLLGFDGLFVSLIIHINCQFKMIKQGFLRIVVRRGDGEGNTNCLKKITELVEHHNLVLGCIKDMEQAYSILLLNQFLTSLVCLCVGLVSIIADGFPPDLQNLSKYLMYVTTVSSQLFFYCAAGNYLISESESVSEAVYESDWWVKTQPELRRAYVLVIQRANKTEKLTAGGMFILNLESFTNIVKTALSFFTLVQAMYSRK